MVGSLVGELVVEGWVSDEINKRQVWQLRQAVISSVIGEGVTGDWKQLSWVSGMTVFLRVTQV